MNYDALAHVRDQVAYALRVIDATEEHHQRIVAWAKRVIESLPPGDPLRVEGEILFPNEVDNGRVQFV